MPKKIATLLSALFLMASPSAFGQSTTYVYDNNGRVVSVEDTDIGVISYVYDDAGNLTNRVVTPGGTAAPPTCNSPLIVGTGNNYIFIPALDICSDPNGDTLTITNAAMTSNNGGSIQVSAEATEVLIADMIACDLYTADFTVSDGNGGTTIGQIEVVRLGC